MYHARTFYDFYWKNINPCQRQRYMFAGVEQSLYSRRDGPRKTSLTILINSVSSWRSCVRKCTRLPAVPLDVLIEKRCDIPFHVPSGGTNLKKNREHWSRTTAESLRPVRIFSTRGILPGWVHSFDSLGVTIETCLIEDAIF